MSKPLFDRKWTAPFVLALLLLMSSFTRVEEGWFYLLALAIGLGLLFIATLILAWDLWHD